LFPKPLIAFPGLLKLTPAVRLLSSSEALFPASSSCPRPPAWAINLQVYGLEHFSGPLPRRPVGAVSPGFFSLCLSIWPHQRPGVDLPVGLLARLIQAGHEQILIPFRTANRLLMISTVHDACPAVALAKAGDRSRLVTGLEVSWSHPQSAAFSRDSRRPICNAKNPFSRSLHRFCSPTERCQLIYFPAARR